MQVHKVYQVFKELLDPKASVEILVILDPRVNVPFLNIFPFENFMWTIFLIIFFIFLGDKGPAGPPGVKGQ